MKNNKNSFQELFIPFIPETIHEQVVTSKGFTVDKNIAQGLEQLWEHGYITSYSCEGDPKGKPNKSRDYYGHTLAGYILFQRTHTKNDKILEHLAETWKSINARSNLIEPTRIVIRFDYEDFPKLVKALLEDTQE